MVMQASRSEAARAVVWADESNLPHARMQGQAPGGRRARPSCCVGGYGGGARMATLGAKEGSCLRNLTANNYSQLQILA